MKFTTKSGYLTHYALSCGYRELATNSEGFNAFIGWDINSYKVTCYNGDNESLVWENCSTIAEARKEFKSLCKKYSLHKN